MRAIAYLYPARMGRDNEQKAVELVTEGGTSPRRWSRILLGSACKVFSQRQLTAANTSRSNHQTQGAGRIVVGTWTLGKYNRPKSSLILIHGDVRIGTIGVRATKSPYDI